jgi:gliding motility-associated protein GldC
MDQQSIHINIALDNQKMPDHIDWIASATANSDMPQQAKAFLLSLWDGQEKAALRIDLWTKKMMVDEMNDFFFQTLMTLADTYSRATKNEALGKEMKTFAEDFRKKAQAVLEKEN